MRTITINVYEFEELSEQAQQKAINILRERAARQACDQDWEVPRKDDDFLEVIPGTMDALDKLTIRKEE